MKRYIFSFLLIVLVTTCHAQTAIKAVDLGLPSGTLWADIDLGAKKPEETGLMYHWAGTKGYKNYNNLRKEQTPYSIPLEGYSKYNDFMLELENIDDAAFQELGTNWNIPTYDQVNELFEICKKEENKKKNFVKFTGPNGNFIVMTYCQRWTNKLKNDYNRFYSENYKNGYAWAFYPSIYQHFEISGRHHFGRIRAVFNGSSPTPKPDKTSALAKISFINCPSTTTEKAITINVGIITATKINNTAVYANGILERGINPVKNDGFNASINKAITLSEGANIIKVEVTNAAGTATAQTSITYQPEEANNPIVSPTIQLKRLALIVGNSEYTHATSLQNPKNDATDVAASLRALGFTVIEKHDLDLKEFKKAINEFGNTAASYDASIFYYAGHAIEKDGKNYLIPVDAMLEKQIDIEYECVHADYVLDNLEAAKSKMNIIVLDACRNNPISRGWSRSASRGLASMIAPAGTFMVYSTSPGKTAADGDGKNSPFTTAFLKCLSTPNVPLYQFFTNVSKEVKSMTGNVQRPWISSDFDGDFYFNKK